jgi:hypothetical protein
VLNIHAGQLFTLGVDIMNKLSFEVNSLVISIECKKIFGAVAANPVSNELILVSALKVNSLLLKRTWNSIFGIELFQYSVPNKKAFLIILPGAISSSIVSVPAEYKLENPAPVTPQ